MIKVNSNISNEMKSSGLKPFHLEKKKHSFKIGRHIGPQKYEEKYSKIFKTFYTMQVLLRLKVQAHAECKYSKYNKLFF